MEMSRSKMLHARTTSRECWETRESRAAKSKGKKKRIPATWHTSFPSTVKLSLLRFAGNRLVVKLSRSKVTREVSFEGGGVCTTLMKAEGKSRLADP